MSSEMPRRDFLERLLAAGVVLQGARTVTAEDTTATATQTTSPVAATPPKFERKIKLGLIGCGGRGNWIGNLFKEHGGFEITSVADYFPETAQKVGPGLGAPAERCFSGLSGYKRVVESGIEAIALETPPYFFPDHAAAAIEAGLHVFMAKPVAVDVPGTLRIGELGKKSTQAGKVFLVDYQMRTDPVNIDVQQRVRDGALGKLQAVWSCGYRDDNGFNDPPLTDSLESRLNGLIWVNDVVLGAGYIVNFDIHIVDALLWLVGKRPVSAYGHSDRCRPSAHGDSRDTYSIVYTFEDGLPWYHQSAAGKGHEWLCQGHLEGSLQGSEAAARVSYDRNSYVRGGPKHVGSKKVEDLYTAGARRNIATFYQQIINGDSSNKTVAQAVDGALTTILGREAALAGKLMTMDDLLKQNKTLIADLRGLKQ